jgi:NEDD4-binding protein 2
MRSIPGGGKTFLANQIKKQAEEAGKTAVIHSTDSYFMKNGVYDFEPDKLGYYHKCNQAACEGSMLKQEEIIVIDNTNITWKDMKRYIELANEYGYRVVFVYPQTSWRMDANECFKRNTHDVPLEAIQRMVKRFIPHNELLKTVWNEFPNLEVV